MSVKTVKGKVGARIGVTLRAGEFQSVRAEVYHELECTRTNRDEVFEEVLEYCRKKLAEEVDRYHGQIQNIEECGGDCEGSSPAQVTPPGDSPVQNTGGPSDS